MIQTKIAPLIFGGLVVSGGTVSAIFIPKLIKNPEKQSETNKAKGP